MNRVEFKNTDSHDRLRAEAQKNGYVMLTGATGLVGQYLLRDLFLRNQRIAVLVRPSKKLSAIERIEAIMQRWESELEISLPRPIILEGCLTESDLCLSDEDQAFVRDCCDRIIHNAAILKFESSQPGGEPWKTNLTGTRYVAEFAKSCGIQEFHYVSTAYVSGTSETFSENDFDVDQQFRNDYERSKFEAEKVLREQFDFGSLTVYRPAVIVGDSQTGYTASYHGLYVYLRLMATLIPHQLADSNGKRYTPLQLDYHGNQPRNLVPVDWVTKVICEVFCETEQHNRTYHLVPDKRPTHGEILEHCYEYFNTAGVRFEEANDVVADSYNDNQFAQQFLDNTAIYSAYDHSDPLYSKANVTRLGEHLECPEITRETIFRFIDFGKRDNWGKRKVRRPDFQCWRDRNEDEIRSLLNQRGDADRIAIDVLGPGGGQWTIQWTEDGAWQINRGIADGVDRIVTIDSKQYQKLKNGKVENFWSDSLKQLAASSGNVLS